MRRVLSALGVVVSAIALAGAAVHGLQDRRTLVPPPEAVAEEFVRQLVTGRSEQALPLLSKDLRAAARPDVLDRYGRELEEKLGNVGNVSGELDSISGDRAEAAAILDGARRTGRLRFGLVRHGGKWMIERLGELDGRGRAAFAS